MREERVRKHLTLQPLQCTAVFVPSFIPSSLISRTESPWPRFIIDITVFQLCQSQFRSTVLFRFTGGAVELPQTWRLARLSGS